MFNSSLDNTFKVGKNLAFELIGSIQTPMIQGTFDIETVYNLTAGLKWSFASDRINLSARCSDLFNSGMPNLKVRFNGQHLDMNNDFYSRSFTIHFSYRFGGYKKKEAGKIDTSRFGHSYEPCLSFRVVCRMYLFPSLWIAYWTSYNLSSMLFIFCKLFLHETICREGISFPIRPYIPCNRGFTRRASRSPSSVR